MSAKKPRFKPRFFGFYVCQPDGRKFSVRCRVTDARDLTAEQAVQKVLQNLLDCGFFSSQIMNICAKPAGMTARVVNGKVRVRRAKR